MEREGGLVTVVNNNTNKKFVDNLSLRILLLHSPNVYLKSLKKT